MSSFSDQSWLHRFSAMGDEAESRYLAIAPTLGHKPVRWGLSRPPFSMTKLDPFIRHAPDFLEKGSFVEVQGGGYDQMVKLKKQKLIALRGWNYFHPVQLFLWDRTNVAYSLTPLARIDELEVDGMFTEGAFDGGTNPYFAFKNWEFDWSPFPEDLL